MAGVGAESISAPVSFLADMIGADMESAPTVVISILARYQEAQLLFGMLTPTQTIFYNFQEHVWTVIYVISRIFMIDQIK